MTAQHEITDQLVALRRSDDPAAWERLVPLVYAELRAIAHRQLRLERDDHTLGTTALVHEAYLRLVDQKRAQWNDRTHFFAMASTVMRRVLIDYARHHLARKRASAQEMVPIGGVGEMREAREIEDVTTIADQRADALVAIDEALARLGAVDERLARLVECRFFGGLTEEETALALGISARTVRRDWVKAKAFLQRALDEGEGSA